MRVLICVLVLVGLAGFSLVGCEERAAEAPTITTPVAEEDIVPASEIPSTVAPMWPDQRVWPTGEPIKADIYADYQGKRIYFPNKEQKRLWDENPEAVFQSLVGAYGPPAR